MQLTALASGIHVTAHAKAHPPDTGCDCTLCGTRADRHQVFLKRKVCFPSQSFCTSSFTAALGAGPLSTWGKGLGSHWAFLLSTPAGSWVQSFCLQPNGPEAELYSLKWTLAGSWMGHGQVQVHTWSALPTRCSQLWP